MTILLASALPRARHPQRAQNFTPFFVSHLYKKGFASLANASVLFPLSTFCDKIGRYTLPPSTRDTTNSPACRICANQGKSGIIECDSRPFWSSQRARCSIQTKFSESGSAFAAPSTVFCFHFLTRTIINHCQWNGFGYRKFRLENLQWQK